MQANLNLIDQPDPTHIRALHGLLLAFNNASSGYAFDGRALLVTLTNPQSNEVLGGLFGTTGYGYLHVDMLIVPDLLRGQGFGTRLMQEAEAEAIRRGCRGSYLDTFSFQARGFYEKLGYSVFGVLEDTPPGHSRFFLRKMLSE